MAAATAVNLDQERQQPQRIVSFTRAQRQGSHVLIALYGRSGSGKTLSALYLARGLVGPEGKIAVLDTETGRAKIYANEAGGFMHADLTPPFTPERYVEAIEAAEAAGFHALVIDSASHEWEGIGGILETAEGSGKSGLGKWAQPKARHKKFVQTLLKTRMHLIICLRAKEKLIQVEVPDGNRTKKEIVSAGMVAIQAKDFIYEMTVQLHMPVPEPGGKRGIPEIEKCPKDLLGAFPNGDQISVGTGTLLREWVAGGTPIDQAFEQLRQAAQASAENGVEAFRTFWRGLDGGARTRLSAQLANLRSVATSADEERARAEEEKRKPATFTQAGGPVPADDPFAEQAGADSQSPPAEPAAQRPAPAPIHDEDGVIHEPPVPAIAALDPPPDNATDKAWRTFAGNLRAAATQAETRQWLSLWQEKNHDGLEVLRSKSAIAHKNVMDAVAARSKELQEDADIGNAQA